MTKQKRRLIPIVDRGFQFKYTALIMGVAAAISVALGWFLLDAYTEMNTMLQMMDLSPEISEELNADDAQRVFVLVIGFLGAEVIILGVLGLLITHRVVGPIFVLHRHLATLVEGKYPALRPLRAGDEFSSTFETFSDAITMLKKRDEEEVAALAALLDAAREKGLDEARVAELEKMIEERKARIG